MNLAVLFHAAVAFWPMAIVLAVVVLAFLFPAVSLPILRWLLGTQAGRYLLLVLVVAGVLAWQWEARFSAGRAFERDQQAAAAARASVHAAFEVLGAYMAGAERMAAINDTREQGHAKALAARDDVIAGLRAGRLQLRDHWQCLPAAATATTGGGSDEGAELRGEGAADLVQVADDADIDLAACQATVTEYQRIGVLRVTP